MGEKYESQKGTSIPIGSPKTLELPPRIFRGRLVGMLFDRDKTFLLPSALRGIKELKRYYDEHPKLEVLIVGHTDSTGDTGYNEKLGKERAQSIAAFLSDKVDAWLGYWKGGKPAGKKWGALEDQHMLAHLAGYDGNLDGKIGPKSKEAIKRFQKDAGKPQTGELDDATRKELVTRYMNADETTLPADAKVTVHGAGPHHPEEKGDDPESLRRNRRVEIFLSEGPIEPPPGAPDGPEHAEWVKASTETVDFDAAPEDLVEIDLEWSSSLVESLPDDLTLTLSGKNITDQVKPKSAAKKEGQNARFEFRWIDGSQTVSLEAKGGGKTVLLWKDQTPGALDVDLVWEASITELLGAGEDEGAAKVTGEAIAARKIPDDLGYDEMNTFEKGLA
jgi:outer membrane protein OmpA-like peptidoglycan-associated protein